MDEEAVPELSPHRRRVVEAIGAFDPRAPWCERCNGYGSSLKDQGDRCPACGGSGLAEPRAN